MTLDDISKYGLPGLSCGVLIFAIRWGVLYIKDLLKEHKEERETLEKFHREERDAWKETIGKQFDQMNQTAKETNQSLKETASLTQSIKVLLENRR